MKKITILLISASLTLVLLVTAVFAYYTDKKTTDIQKFTLGKISYTLQGELNPDFAMAGVNLITSPMRIKNTSTIASEIRISVKVTSSIFGEKTLDEMFGEDSLGEKYYSLDSGWVLDGAFYYYRGLQSTETLPGVYSIAPSNQTIPILTVIILDGYKFSNNHANHTINIQMIFEAKQADFVTWEELGIANYDFSIGE